MGLRLVEGDFDVVIFFLRVAELVLRVALVVDPVVEEFGEAGVGRCFHGYFEVFGGGVVVGIDFQEVVHPLVKRFITDFPAERMQHHAAFGIGEAGVEDPVDIGGVVAENRAVGLAHDAVDGAAFEGLPPAAIHEVFVG